MRKIYTFCDIDHPKDVEHDIKNHIIIALDDTGEVVGHWVSSNHSFGKTDILSSLEKIEYPHEVEWVDHPPTHPELSKLLQ